MVVYFSIGLCFLMGVYAYFYSNTETRIVIQRKSKKQKFTVDCYKNGLIKGSYLISSNELEGRFRALEAESRTLAEEDYDFITGKPIKKKGKKKNANK